MTPEGPAAPCPARAPTEPPVRILMSASVDAELRADAERAAASGGRPAELLLFRDHGEFAAHLRRCEVLYGRLRPAELQSAPHLRWVHVGSAGVDGLPLGELAAAGVLLTNARGQHADAMADHAFALLLALSRGLPAFVQAQARRSWQPAGGPGEPGELAGRRLGILGYGAIGQAIAGRAVAFGMEVWATRRHAARPAGPGVARLLGPGRGDLLTLLAACDDVVSVLPSTAATRGAFDQEAFATLRPGARLVNLGRGDVLVEAALEAALRSGALAGAACDCLPREPLPPEAGLWSAPNLLITPHVGGQHPGYARRGMAIFAANLTRYCRGLPLHNAVDLEAGY